MNSTEIKAVIDRIAMTSSRLGKIELLENYLHDELFRQVCVWAYSPEITFGVDTKTLDSALGVVAGERNPNEDFGPSTYEVIMSLECRDLRGNAAQNALTREFGRLNLESAELLYRLLAKDLRAGFGESSLNKARPGTIPEYPYMRCSLPSAARVDKWDWKGGHFVQEKADGMFAALTISGLDRRTQIRTRAGTLFDNRKLPHIFEAAKHIPTNTQTHGELIVKEALSGRVLSRQEGNGYLNSLLDGSNENLNYVVEFATWDMLTLAELAAGKSTRPYEERFDALCRHIGGRQSIWVIITKRVSSYDEAKAFYVEQLQVGKEGAVLKHWGAAWVDGTSKFCVKLKQEVTVDLAITKVIEGAGKYEGMAGAVECQTRDGLLVTNVNVRTDAMREFFWSNDMVGGILSVKANAVIEREGSNTKSLFLPVMIELRKDKKVADSLIEVEQQFKNAIK